MRKFILSTCLFVITISLSAQQPASVKEYQQAFPTYPFSDPNPIALLSPVYPYFRYDGFTDKPVSKQWKVVELQNDYIKMIILPEIGGKIWAAIEKKTDKSFIYYNHSVKFRDVAMRGPWTSGGLEANYGIIGHTPNCATPVDYTTRNNPDGSVSCFIGVLDLLTRSNWRVEINLPKDKAYFTTRSFWYNSTPEAQPYYHWMNLGVKAKGNLEFIFPGTKYIGHDGEASDWPVNKDNGKKINFYEENNFGGYKSYHVFGKPAHFFGTYYHEDDNGMVRYGTYDDKAGRKIWIWGLSRQGMIWEKMLTDTDGQYVEIQSGRMFNQNAVKSTFTPFKHISFAPYATDTWTEYWYPVSQTKGMVDANANGALNVKYENGWLKIYFSAAQHINDSLLVKWNDKTIYTKKLQLDPLQIFSDSLKTDIKENELNVTLGANKLKYHSAPDEEILNRPVTTPVDFDWNSAYGLYLQGEEFMDQKMYPEAELKLTESLKKDPNFLPALVKMAALQYRNMLYSDALKTIMRALQIDTHAGDANYYYGLINAQLGKIADAKDGFSLAALTQEYRSAAFTGLAKLYIKEKNYTATIDYCQKAIDYNRYNMEALMLQAAALRQMNNNITFNETLNTILSYDPLNHFARFEKYLAQPNETTKSAFSDLIKNELPHETHTELATWYYNNGLTTEAEMIFKMSPASAETSYWLAFLNNKKVDCEKINPELAFPFRSETAAVLEQLLKQQSDWLLKYQLALIYKDRNRLQECKQLLKDCDNEPAFAPFYVERAEIFKDETTELPDLQRALALDKKQWRYHKLLAEYYIRHKQPSKALTIAEPFYKAHPERYIMGMLYAKTLLLNQKYEQADKILSTLNIIPFEGATEGRALYREAKLMQAVASLNSGNADKSKKLIAEARLWPETLGVGKPYEADIDARLEDWMEYLAGNKKQEQLLTRIKIFTPKVDNTVRNFVTSNALISAWAIEKTEGKEKAIEWLDAQINQHSDQKKILTWCKAVFNGDKLESIPEDEKDASMRIIEALIK
ncbi:DUF5107 domain-containing protein [Niabella ginsengisoli]|uniref:DUF5107 domain-containing protein n=1 Tax=Niabella ginsengisoli TaxID=522298 RepID=A0ABS9SQ16_9BACT|nr:DUF5107 domain-containing protein [Niabella ginsengisoli]MCH5600356.1 DUF5107 domain-containing protein [Niabella ginsengisoli]